MPATMVVLPIAAAIPVFLAVEMSDLERLPGFGAATAGFVVGFGVLYRALKQSRADYERLQKERDMYRKRLLAKELGEALDDGD